MEIDNFKLPNVSNNTLFEGYLYDKNYLITDILFNNGSIVDCNYSLRYSIINKLVQNEKILNGHLTFGIHSVFEDNDNIQQLIGIFKSNFKYKKDICSLEYFYKYSYLKEQEIDINKNDDIHIMNITKGKYTDIYNVQTINGENEGMLYIKTISDAKYLRSLNIDSIIPIQLQCKYNNHFKKWYVQYNVINIMLNKK